MLFLLTCSSLGPRAAVATDIANAAALSTVGALLHLADDTVNLGVAANLLVGSIPGILVGGRLAQYAPAPPAARARAPRGVQAKRAAARRWHGRRCARPGRRRRKGRGGPFPRPWPAPPAPRRSTADVGPERCLLAAQRPQGQAGQTVLPHGLFLPDDPTMLCGDSYQTVWSTHPLA